MDSLTFLSQTPKKILPFYVFHGDEDFLRRRALLKLRKHVVGDDADEFSLSSHDGDKAEYAAVMDELHTVAFFSSRRLVVVEKADPFVTRYRQMLEKAVKQLPDSATLVLDVKTWPANTKLAKLVPKDAAITCKALPAAQLSRWCVDWTATQHNKQLTQPAARLLVDLIGAEMGLLDQELGKLAVYAGDRKRIDENDVDQLVGRNQAQNTWKIFDAIGQGNMKESLAILDRLFQQGEEPLRIVGAFSMQLRRLAQAGRLARGGKPLRAALVEVGTAPYFVDGCQQQIRHLGSDRVEKLYDQLLQLNLNLRGNSPLSPRMLLERFVIELARRQ